MGNNDPYDTKGGNQPGETMSECVLKECLPLVGRMNDYERGSDPHQNAAKHIGREMGAGDDATGPIKCSKSEPEHFGFWEMIGQDGGYGKGCGGMTGGKGVPSTFK